ncbi:hypothetical protein OG440_40580 (plasmid) [Streptomyces sp. NBC_00637]|uniref:hypothetical protein n=1 Tax=Streptomyces sp. NBC_00637 TaxID=2903667 RepID=UPI002F9183AC
MTETETGAGTVTAPKVQPLRFVDGDSVRSPQGATWRRGLRTPGLWEQFPLAPETGTRTDDQVRAALGGQGEWLFVPFLPPVNTQLPGTACATPEQIRDLVLRPASGAVMYAVSLGRAQAFLGNEQGVPRKDVRPDPLRLADLRATLQGVRTRRASAGITFHRLGGRAYVRYATGSTLHTHLYLLTR